MNQQETLAAELQSMQGEVKLRAVGIDQKVRDLDQSRLELREVVDEYNKKRDELFTLELEEKGMICCCQCISVVLEANSGFLFHERSLSPSCVERVCSGCWKFLANSRGVDVFMAEKREDGFYAKKFDVWFKLDEEKFGLFPQPKRDIDPNGRSTKEFDLPPKIQFIELTDPMELRIGGQLVEAKLS